MWDENRLSVLSKAKETGGPSTDASVLLSGQQEGEKTLGGVGRVSHDFLDLWTHCV